MIKEVVKQIPFFNALSDDELREIVKIGQEKYVESGQLLFKEDYIPSKWEVRIGRRLSTNSFF